MKETKSYIIEQAKMCLNCKIGNPIISEYKHIYALIKKENLLKEISSNKDFSTIVRQNESELLFELFDTFNINGYIVNKINKLSNNTLSLKGVLKKYYNELEATIKDKTNNANDIMDTLSLLSNRKISIKSMFSEEEKEIINELSDLLEINGSIAYKYEALKKLQKPTKLEEYSNLCIKNISKILSVLYNDFPTDDTSLELNAKKDHFVDVIKIMDGINRRTIENYNSKDTKLLINYLTEASNTHKQNGLISIFNVIFDNYSMKATINGNNSQASCFMTLFENYLKKSNEINTLESQEIKQQELMYDFFKRVNNLSKPYQKIIIEYIKYAPKKFGYMLQKIMSLQNMTEQDIINLPCNSQNNDQNTKWKNVSTIQSWKTSDNPRIDNNDLSTLCKVLLVSENVLYHGVGKIYGNWMNLINDNSLDKASKERVKHKISQIIGMNNIDFNNFLSDNANIFYQEQFPTFDYWKSWIYKDLIYIDIWNSILNKKEAYTLLEVLEKVEGK